MYRLRKAGYEAYLVGGGVRDLLLGREPKDFDVVTDALPDEVRQVFRNCRLIGRRFRLAHVQFGHEIIEVATFRSAKFQQEGSAEQTENGMILADNDYGTIEEDALRRDFSVNALYYNIADFSVIDYANGMADLRAGRLRLLGDPDSRFREDPVRMIRAARFAAKLGFNIDPAAEQGIYRLGGLLHDVPAARLFEEVLKLFLGGYAVAAFEKLRHYNLFGTLFPETDACLSHEQNEFPLELVRKGLESTDARIAEDKPVTPAYLFAVLLWEPIRQKFEKYIAEGMAPHPAMHLAADEVLDRQIQRVAIPRRFSTPMRDIWVMQTRLEQTRGQRPARLLEHPKFRAGYDFLMLRAESGEADPQLADWWTKFQAGQNVEPMGNKPAGSRRRRRRKG